MCQLGEEHSNGIALHRTVGFDTVIQRVQCAVHGLGFIVRRGHVGTIRLGPSTLPSAPGSRRRRATRHSGRRCMRRGDLPGNLGARRPCDRKAVDVATHIRARALQAGALVALVLGMLAAVSSPALADDPGIQITSVSSTTLNPGDSTTLKYTVVNNNQTPGQVQVTISAGGMYCTDGCSPAGFVGADDNTNHKDFSTTLTAPRVDPGQTRTFQVQISARIGNDSGQVNQQFTVRGADKPQTVREVNGRVKDQDGKSLSGAVVGVQDKQGNTYEATSNDEGRFRFTSSDNAPILAGNLSVGAVKAKYQNVTVQVQGGV